MRIGVIGGGYAGLHFALSFSRYCNVTVYEDHLKIGYPEHCTGLISDKTAFMLGRLAEKCLDKTYNSIVIYGSTIEHQLVISRKKIVYHVDRVCLERRIYSELEGHAQVNLGCRTHIEDPLKRTVIGCKGKTRYDYIVVAEGNQRTNTRSLYKYRPDMVTGVNAEVVLNKRIDPENIIVGFDHRIASGYFYWVVPLTESKAIIGLGTRRPRKITKSIGLIAAKHGLSVERTLRLYGGGINRGPPLPLSSIPHKKVLVIGDAAGMSKPVTGGGLYPLAAALSRLGRNDCIGRLEEFKRIYNIIGGNLRKQKRIADILHSPLNQKLIDNVLDSLREEFSPEFLGSVLDYDEHYHGLKKIFVTAPLRTAALFLRLLFKDTPGTLKTFTRLIAG